MEVQKNVRNLLLVEPFRRAVPMKDISFGLSTNGSATAATFDAVWEFFPQSKFLTELYTSGHKINDVIEYPDVVEEDEIEIDGRKEKRWRVRKVSRVALPFQKVILVQQLVHLCGNKIKFKDSNNSPSDSDKQLLIDFKQMWLDKNMEVAFYECVRSLKATGNCALGFYFEDENGKKTLKWKSYSLLDDYIICKPYKDVVTGKTIAQAIMYKNYDEEGTALTNFVDVWDDVYFYRFKQDLTGAKGAVNKLLKMFGLENYAPVGEPIAHGFNRVPIVTNRDNMGACWSLVQSLIEQYEVCVSQLCDNSKVLATAILFLKGGDAEIKGAADGKPFAIVSTDSNADAKFLTRDNASTALDTTLKILKENILLGSFTVLPPEVRSGDLPGIAIKLIYSPSLDNAIVDAKFWDKFLDEVVSLFKYGIGIELEKLSYFEEMRITGNIEPYVHENTQEIINNVCMAKNSGLTSIETGSSNIPFNASDEYNIIQQEVERAKQQEESQLKSIL